MQDLVGTLDYRIKRYESLKNKSSNLSAELIDLQKSLDVEQSDLKTIKESAIYYKKSQDIIYEKSVGFLKELINSALKFIFFDKNYEILIELDDKRGTKTLSFKLRDVDNDFEVSLKNGCGNGVRSVVSAILNIFALVNKGKRVLIVDEKYSHVSVEYLPNFFTFLTKLCSEKDLIVILVTHDPRMTSYPEKVYRVCDGRVEEVINA